MPAVDPPEEADGVGGREKQGGRRKRLIPAVSKEHGRKHTVFGCARWRGWARERRDGERCLGVYGTHTSSKHKKQCEQGRPAQVLKPAGKHETKHTFAHTESAFIQAIKGQT